MAEAYSGKVIASGLSYGGYRAYVNGYIQSQTDDNVVVYGGGAIQGTRASGFGVAGNVTINGSGVTSFSGVINNTGSNWANVCSNSGTLTLARQQNAYNVTVTCNAWGQTVNGYGSAGGSTSTSVTVTIPARPYYAHGNPSVWSSSNHCEVGGKVTISWSKSGTQGNANFDRFELWQGSTKLYSGSGTSYSVTPSSATGSGGGTATYTLKEIHEWYGSYPSTQASVSVAVRGPHGNPTLSASKTTANYGESVNLSWAKSSTQGNAAFARFELWQGSNKLYSGSAVSKSVVPSDATGPKGGTATYVLKEIHEWYGSYPTTQTSKSITVRSGVVSVYDSGGAKHTGLVTAYDSSGNSHYVLITAYDSSGKAHSVV